MKVSIPGKETSIFAGLPDKEIEFLVEHSVRIARESSDGSLESILQAVANFGKGREYGWEEAILSGKWYRWPSEVKEQIFCSEKALMTYLLLQTIGIKAKYAIVPNYGGTRMNHEVVFVPTENTLLLVDWWHVHPTERRDGKILTMDNGMAFDEAKIKWIPDDQVVPRVLHAQSGKSFMNAISCGQVLYRRFTPEGEVEAFVKYSPRGKQLQLVHLYRPVVAAPAFYIDQNFWAKDDGIKSSADFGVVKHDRGLNFSGWTYIAPLDEFDAIAMLPQWKRRDIKLYIVYDSTIKSKGGEEIFCMPESERQAALQRFRHIAKTGENDSLQPYSQFVVERYDRLRTVRPYYAERFLDFQMIRTAASREMPNEKDPDDILEARNGLVHPALIPMVHMGISLQEMSQVMSAEKTVVCHRRLCEELARQTGLPYDEVKPEQYLDVIGDFQKGSLRVWGPERPAPVALSMPTLSSP